MHPQVVNVDNAYTEEPDYYSFIQERIEAAGGELVRLSVTTEDDIIAACQHATMILVEQQLTPITDRVIANVPECQAIMKCSIGVDTVDMEAASSHGIIVCNAAGFCAEEVSDHAIALLLGCVRRIHAMDANIRQGGWFDFPSSGSIRRVQKLTLGLIGFGAIGRAVARKMSGFRMRLLVHDSYVQAESGAEFVPLQRLLSESDIVSLHVPLTTETRNLLGTAQFADMKSTAFLINTSRGGVVDENALVQALQERRIAGAGLDVVAQEPLPESSPLRKLDNVVLTPHYAGHSADSMEALANLVADSTEAILKGYWPPFPVNPKALPRTALKPWKTFEQSRTAMGAV
jgi:D-3-phosphoglycerate dehydrogenase